MKSISVQQENVSKAIIKAEGNTDFTWKREAQLQEGSTLLKEKECREKITRLPLKDAKSSSFLCCCSPFPCVLYQKRPSSVQRLLLVISCSIKNLGLSAKKIMLPGKPPACLGNVIKRMHTPKKEKRTLSQPIGTLSPNSISHPFSPFPPNLDFHVSLCLSCSSVSW